MNDIIVIEDCISKTMQDIVESEVFAKDFPWFFLENITFNGLDAKNKEKLGTHYGLTHVFLDSNRGVYSPSVALFLPIIASAMESINTRYIKERLLAGRLFLQLPNGEASVPNNAHIDLEEPHIVFLYYVNDSDGDTVIFDKTTKDVPPSDLRMRHMRPGYKEYEQSMFSPMKTITPKKGTVVIFDGSRYHASSNPTTNKRCVVNFNYRK
jgi:hypothetical protein